MSSSRKGASHVKDWRAKNPEKLASQRKRAAEKRAEKRRTDPEFKAAENAKAARRNAKHFQRTKVSRSAVWYLKAARKRAAERGLPYDLDNHLAYYQAVLDAGVCQMTGLPFQREKRKQGPFAPTLDRVVPKLGYVHGNVRVVVWALNRAMGEWGFDFLAHLVDSVRATSA